METSRIAVVSTDGKTVNDHFGKAERFLIYDVDDKLTFVEKRRLKNIQSTIRITILIRRNLIRHRTF